MRYTLTSLFMLLCTVLHAQEHSALLLVHYGTTFADTRAKTIDAINQKAKQAFPHLAVCEAYASPIVTKRLAQRGEQKALPLDALLRLRADGHRRIVVQPTFVIDGKEMAQLRNDIEQVRPFFDDITLGTPLLHSVDDARRLCTILADRHPANASQREHVVFVGHGTQGPATALYSQLDYMLHAEGHTLCHVATIEGYPTLQTLIASLKAQQAHSVTLVPLLFVAGNHANADIAGEWRQTLEHEGFAVNVCLEGLGEVPAIQELYIEKARR